ncbi:hypothetical protein [Aquimarina rubra]|uniref:Uncharacterized protein n=1 Tax=Aquimarina rubra TaxID=1920033 RepID=A0ABW5LDJ5_9FLAO
MLKKELDYNFHDAIVVSCEMEKEDRLSLVVMLYEVFYLNKGYLKITFSGIFNSGKVNEFIYQLDKDAVEPNWNGTRIDNLNYHTKKISKDLDQNLVLNLDGYQPINIHCKKLRIEKQTTSNSI